MNALFCLHSAPSDVTPPPQKTQEIAKTLTLPSDPMPQSSSLDEDAEKERRLAVKLQPVQNGNPKSWPQHVDEGSKKNQLDSIKLNRDMKTVSITISV